MKPQLNKSKKSIIKNDTKPKNIKKQTKTDTIKQQEIQEIQEQDIIKCRTQKNLCVSFH